MYVDSIGGECDMPRVSDNEKKRVQVNVKVSGDAADRLQEMIAAISGRLGTRVSKAQVIEMAISALFEKEKREKDS